MLDKKKCDKCQEADAVVYFASVSGKGRASRHRYCKKCAKEERIRLMPAAVAPQQPVSVLSLVQQELAKSAAGEKTTGETPERAIKRLNKAMKVCIDKEDYEQAAKIRDEIAALSKPGSTTCDEF